MFKLKNNIDFILFSLITCALILLFLSCKAYECKQCTSDLQCLLKEANDTQQRLIGFLNTLKSKYKDAIIIDPGIKQMKTINQLLKIRWNGDASMITDYARATIGLANLYEVYCCLEDIKVSSFQIISIRDNFFQPYPSRYRDINIVFKDPVNNHLGEIQINILNMLKYNKKKGYELFDKRRKIKFQAFQDNRSLSAEENKEIEALILQEISENNKAFGESMKITNKILRIGVCGILIHNDEVCMVQEYVGSKLIYNFPGGKVEDDEGLAEALIRKCKEEISVDVLIKDQLYSNKNLYMSKIYPNTYMVSLYYVIEADKNKIKKGVWFPINKLPLDEMLPIDKEFAEALKTTLYPNYSKTLSS